MNNPTSFAYETVHEFTCWLREREVRFCSKPGLPAWRQVSPPARLLAEQIPASVKSILWLGCGHGAAPAAVALALPDAQIWLCDSNWIALQMASRTLAANGLAEDSRSSARLHIHTGISVLPEQKAAFDLVAIDLPKGRDLARRWLLEAWAVLRPGGQLYLAGANDQGIKSGLQDAEALFGPAGILAYKKGCRLARLIKAQPASPAPDWSTEAGIQPGTWCELKVALAGSMRQVRSLAGVFSAERMDDGTRLLLEHLAISTQEKVLDIGCGWGAIGLAAALSGASQVDLVDNNLLAIASAGENLRLQRLPQARALPSDALSAVQGNIYSLILSNPPFHAGKGVDYHMAHAFIRQSWQALQPNGRLVVVANRFIRYEQVLREIFPQVNCLIEDTRYHVLAGVKTLPIAAPAGRQRPHRSSS